MSQLPGNQFDPFAPSPPLIPEPPTGGPTMHSPQMAGYQGLNVAQQQQQQPQQYQQPTGYNMASRQQQQQQHKQQQQLQQQQLQQQHKQQQQQQQALNSTAVFGGNANVAGGGQLVPVNSQQSQFAVYNVPQQQPNFTQQSFPSQMQYPHQQQQAYPGSFMAQPTQSMPSPQLQIPMQTQQLYPPPVSYQQQQQQQNQHQHQQYQMLSLSSSELEQPNHYQQRQTAPPRPSTDFEQMINRTKKPDDVSTDTVETSNTSKKPYETPTKQPSSTHLVSSSIPNPPISSTNAKFHQQAVSPLGSVASMATHKDNGPIIFQPQTDNQINSPSRNRNNSKDNNHNHNETDQYNENTVESREKEKEIHAVSRFLASQSDNFTELPNPDHVHSAGYILSRISLRTIFMKKWKQTYWMRYGPTGTAILFFRSKEDAEDWLHNPYHQKKERDFLIKLKIDFVKDLDKANVKGYRAAQISVKNYQNQVYHQFKLERWMDYGPAIACAFASQEGAEAVRLRNVILECMKSSPRDVYTRQCYEQAHAEAEYIQENRKPYDDSYAHQQTFSYDSVKEDSDNNVIPSDTTYFQYDADTLAIDQLQTQKADNNTVAKGRYNNYKI